MIQSRSPMDPPLEEKYARLLQRLGSLGRVVLAYSGGVDSAFLLKACADALGPDVRAVLGSSPSVAPEVLQRARDLAAAVGVELAVVQTDEMSRPEYLANGPDRCFHCKDVLFERLRRFAREFSTPAILDGTNADDLADIRPGREAARRHGVISPLAEEGWSKEEIRRASRALGLPSWSQPASPCLSSRIPFGTPVSLEALERIGEAERRLHALGYLEVRVRHHGDLARIEVPASALESVFERREEVLAAVRESGYALVTLDLEGYRTGGADPSRRRPDDARLAGK